MKIQLVGKTGKMGQTLTSLIENDPTFTLSEEGDVVIDFSSSEGTRKAIALGKPLVCGTTALEDDVWKELQALSKKVPVLYSPNFSFGILAYMQALAPLKKILGPHATLTVSEEHHAEKKDAPSGTAKKIGEALGIEADAIGVKREGEIVGIYQVEFLLKEETVSLRHEAHSREAYAGGALQAAQFIFQKPARLYALEELF